MHGIERKKNEEFKKYLKKHTHTHTRVYTMQTCNWKFPKAFFIEENRKKSVICAYFIFSTTKYFVNNFSYKFYSLYYYKIVCRWKIETKRMYTLQKYTNASIAMQSDYFWIKQGIQGGNTAHLKYCYYFSFVCLIIQ